MQTIAAFIGLGASELLLLVVVLPLVIAWMAFWIWMIVDCATKEVDPGSKIAWMLVIIFVSFIGAPLYFFVRMLPRRRQISLEVMRHES